MRRYTLTTLDLLAISSCRGRVDHELWKRWAEEPADKRSTYPPMAVANNREIQAILEHTRELVPVTMTGGLSYDDYTVKLVLERHGMPGWRGAADIQPEFDDLPRV